MPAGDHLGLQLWRYVQRYPLLVVVAACVLCLAPFADKAVRIDDPLFLWTAQQIRRHPLDFYGFDVHWYFSKKPMWDVTKNPPLAAYYLALIGSIFGTSEVALHLGMLVWAVGAMWGTYRLAERLCRRPLLATLTALLTPVFLVSSSNLMCDTMMLCLWVWAILWWERGLDGSWGALVGAGILAGLCPITKYFGISLIPLLLVHGLIRKRGPGKWLWALAIPVAIVAGYELHTYRLYGHPLLTYATVYSRELSERFGFTRNLLPTLRLGLTFTGGCVAGLLFFAPLLWRNRLLLCLIAGGLALAVIRTLMTDGEVDGRLEIFTWPFVLTETVYATAGVLLIALAVIDLFRKRDASSLLLSLWVLGTFVFAAFVNWSMNGRSVLPVVPATGILLARQFDRLRGSPEAAPEWRLFFPLIPAAGLALLVAWADYAQANSARTAADLVWTKFGPLARPLWFEGHWGFQYYMERLGGRPTDLVVFDPVRGGRFDVAASGLKEGDLVVAPTHNTYVIRPMPDQAEGLDMVKVRTPSWVSTMNLWVRAGFYAHTSGGPLPYGFGPLRVGKSRKDPNPHQLESNEEGYILFRIGSPH